MKKHIIILFFVLFALFCPFSVKAASISVAGTTATGVVGGTVTVQVTLSDPKGLGSWQFNLGYDTSKLQLTSGDVNITDYTSGIGETKRTYTYKFKVKAEGSASVYIASSNVYNWEEEQSSPKDSTTIKCITRESVEAVYSSNNNLSSLVVEGYDLSFDKNVTEYTLEVEPNINKIIIQATQEDNKASLSGVGEFEVHEGANAFDVVVTAENGSSKTYHLTVTVKELNPVKVELASVSYTIVRKKDELLDIVPKHFEETTVQIGEEEVLAYQNKLLDLLVVALKDDKGKIQFYSYKNNQYTLYQELSGGNLTIHLLEDTSMIPEGYQKKKVNINDQSYTIYQRKGSSYYLLYGENVETGEKGLYLYDSVDKTLQRYYQEDINELKKKIQMQTYVILFALCLIIVIIVIFILLIKKKKKLNQKIEKKREERLK